jgi:hypothetical protein
MKKYIYLLLSIILLSSCRKQYSGYCISGSSQSDYQVLDFVENASTRGRAERKVENILNKKFPTETGWSCTVK